VWFIDGIELLSELLDHHPSEYDKTLLSNVEK
jgi:hypothetical protein